MADYVYQEFPRMLYRPGGEKSQEIWGHRLDTLIVNTLDEKTSAIYQGWSVDPQQAIKKSIRNRQLMIPWHFYCAHWKWFWGIVVAVVVKEIVERIAS